MNKTDMIEAIEAQDGLIARKYKDGCARCAIGALADFKGIEIPPIMIMDEACLDRGITHSVARDFANALCEAYSCDIGVLTSIQEMNDWTYSSPNSRKDEVVSYIQSWL